MSRKTNFSSRFSGILLMLLFYWSSHAAVIPYFLNKVFNKILIRQLKLISLTIAIFLLLSIQAQTFTDVTSTYLVNTSFDSNYDFAIGATGNWATGGASQKKALTGWTTSTDANSCAGVFQYGTAATFNNATVPAANGGYGGSAGGCLVMSNGWSGVLTYTKNVTLPAGTYRLEYAAMNRVSFGISANRFGFIPTGGTAVYGTRTTTANLPLNTWVIENVNLTLTHSTVVTISMGFVANNISSNSMAKLCIDYVKLFHAPDKTVLTSIISTAQSAHGDGSGVGAESLNTAITNAQTVNSNESAIQSEINTAVNDLKVALSNYLSNNITISNPFNITNYIANPSFETWQTNQTASIPAWTNTNSMQTQNNVPNQTWIKNGNMYAERWVSSGTNLPAASLTQTVTGLPNGRYRMTLSAHAIQQSNASLLTTGAFAFANEASTAINVGGNYSVENIVVTNGTMNLGFRLVAPITCNWTGFDNFQLFYHGPILDPVISAPQTSISFTTTSNTASIELTGANLSNDISITVPSSNITLTGGNVSGTSPNYTIALANANQINNITATWDRALNVSGNISFTSGVSSKTITISSSDVETVTLSGINLSAGLLSPAFSVGTTSYNVKVPANVSSATVNATTNPSIATVTNNGTTLSGSNTSVVLTGNSFNGNTQTAGYTVNWGGNFTMSDWAANGSTDAVGSVPTVYGWSAIPTLSWVNANSTAVGTVRYMDMVNGANAGVGGVTYTHNAVNYNGRIMFVRWDGSATRVYSYPVRLEACKIYNFTTKAAYNSVASAGTLTFRINTANDNSGTNYATGNIVTTTAGTLISGGINNFSVPSTGVYFLTITSTQANLCAIADLQLTEVAETNLIVNRSYLFLDNSADGVSKTFNLSANLSGSDFSLSAPTGISLSKTNVTAEEAQCGIVVTATFDNAANISGQSITITNGTLSANILVDAIANNLIGSWDANGSVGATASIPTNNGWASTGTVNWVAANLGTVGSVRYFDNPSGYTYGGNTYHGRVIYPRWDGSHSLAANAVYSLPVSLVTGKTYGFKGKFAWNSNGSSPAITVRINSLNNNNGPSYGIGTTTTGAFGVLTDGSFEFSVPESGTYYLTFNANTESFNAIADLAIYEISNVSNVNMLIERADYNLAANFNVNSVTVRPGYKFTVNNGASLNAASVVLEGNVTQNATMINEGTTNITSATVQQYLTAGRNWYIASPVTGAQSGVIKSNEANRLWKRDVAANQWTAINAVDEVLTPVRGYIAKVAESGTVNFTGALNDGPLSYALNAYPGVNSGRFHLVGNPYPSYLDWQAVVAANADVMPTMWKRTKTAGEGAASLYAFATVQIATGVPIIISNNAFASVTNSIPPMQGFWVRLKDDVSSSQFAVNNSMRSHADIAGNRLKAPPAVNKLLRLVVSNGTNIDEAVIYFNQNASDNYDLYDSPKMFNNVAAIPEIYTRAGNEQLVINGMHQYSFGTQMALGFKTLQSNTFSIHATEMKNFDSDTRVILIDQFSNTQTDLTEGESYSFTSDATNTEDRFVVMFKSATGTTTVDDALAGSMYLSSTQGKLRLQLNTEISNASVTVFNATGQSIHSQAVVAPTTVLNTSLDAGVYLVKVTNGGRTSVLRTIVR